MVQNNFQKDKPNLLKFVVHVIDLIIFTAESQSHLVHCFVRYLVGNTCLLLLVRSVLLCFSQNHRGNLCQQGQTNTMFPLLFWDKQTSSPMRGVQMFSQFNTCTRYSHRISQVLTVMHTYSTQFVNLRTIETFTQSFPFNPIQ